MTPTTTSPRRAPRPSVRRAAVLTIGAIALGSTPLVANALDTAASGESIDPAITVELLETPPSSAPATTTPTTAPLTTTPPEPAAGVEPTPAPTTEPAETSTTTTEPAPDPALVAEVIVDTYEWDENGPRVEALQEALGIEVDGWYGAETADTHRRALEFLGAPTDGVPQPPEPVQPPAAQSAGWVALRNCESGGDYTITNPSGRYRGAYQFDQSTWDSVASRHAPHLVGSDPAAAAPGDQDAMALALYGERGSSPWPHCGRYLN